MADRTLLARVGEDRETGQDLLVCSPAVGILDRVPARGSYVDPVQSRLTLRIVGRRHAVGLPAEARGWVTKRLVEDPFSPVEYDQPLFRLSRSEAPQPGQESGEIKRADAAGDLEEGLVPLRSPSHGVFYRRRDPQSPPYVEEGSEVEAGTVLGLVEIMKCFHPITYGGAGLPQRGTVVRILVEDASEVEFEQALFLFRAAD